MKHGNRSKDRTGEVHKGVRILGRSHKNEKEQNWFWSCVCEKGHTFCARYAQIAKGALGGCGECRRLLSVTHGMSKNPIYCTWRSMLRRCYNPRDSRYYAYGGRGIQVCKRWHTIENFFKDMGNRPSPKHSLDRINNDGDYSPKNCRWATAKMQMRNRGNTKFLSFNGETLPLASWAEKMDIDESVLRSRIKRGWTPSDALSIPANGKTNIGAKIYLEVEGVRLSVPEWAKRLGINRTTIYSRLKRGDEPKIALLSYHPSKERVEKLQQVIDKHNRLS